MSVEAPRQIYVQHIYTTPKTKAKLNAWKSEHHKSDPRPRLQGVRPKKLTTMMRRLDTRPCSCMRDGECCHACIVRVARALPISCDHLLESHHIKEQWVGSGEFREWVV